ncbi:MAG: hypothetical protein II627_08135, partial [Lachnospiraceae bacterium]|nr:hypothetical protein [Lachnospiraceae bacterium]
MIIMNNDPAPAAADEFQTDEPGTGNGFRTQACSDAGQGRIIRKTSSLCPVCLKKIPAVLERKERSQAPGQKQISTSRTMVFMKKTCPDHGTFQVP